MVAKPAVTPAADREPHSNGTTAQRTDAPKHSASDNGLIGVSGGVHERAFGSVLAVISSAPASAARAILDIADLERSVSAVRMQLFPGAQHEVIVELRCSVLEGSRVKLRPGVDGRMDELGEILRSRGVNLAALNSTAAHDAASGHKQSGHDRPRLDEGASRPAFCKTPAARPVEIRRARPTRAKAWARPTALETSRLRYRGCVCIGFH